MKKCRVCGEDLIQRAHESKKRFSKKQFCSSKCSRVYLKEHKLGWWSKENKSDFIFPEEVGEI